MGPGSHVLGGTEEGGRQLTLREGFHRVDIFPRHEPERSCPATESSRTTGRTRSSMSGENYTPDEHVAREVNRDQLFALLCLFQVKPQAGLRGDRDTGHGPSGSPLE